MYVAHIYNCLMEIAWYLDVKVNGGYEKTINEQSFKAIIMFVKG